ncbi:MAG: ABC transporter ATP-binding protein [Mycoplasmatales bacterium]
MLLVMLNGPILSLGLTFSQISQVIIEKELIYEILDAKSDAVNVNKPLKVVEFNNIEYKNVVFKYPFDEDSVIKNISFNIPKGKTIVIVGPTGSGKSTVVRQLLSEFNITKGHIYIDGKGIEEFNIQDVRNLVGYVPQSHILFKGDVENNIRVGNPEAKQDKIQKAIHIADFEKDLSNLSDGLMTEVGEKQIISFARALVYQPSILVLDEETANMDTETEIMIQEALEVVSKDRTMIVITHRLSTIREADNTFVLDHGNLIKKGNYNELIKQNGIYANMYRSQVTVESK